MEIVRALVLGIVQGVTEFLPVSSDGHLVLVPSLLGWKRFGLGFDVILHAGTLLATIIYFRSELWSLVRAVFSSDPGRARDRRLAWLIAAATVPSVIVVFALDPFVESVDRRPVPEQIAIAAWGLVGTAVLLGVSEIIARMRRNGETGLEDAGRISWPVALGIGFVQGFAVLPGLSRSGATISAGQALGIKREEAARFSFLMSVPIIVAATAKKSLDLLGGQGHLPSPLATLTGLVTTTVVGYAAIWFLLPFVRKHSLWWFAAYTGVAGILLLLR